MGNTCIRPGSGCPAKLVFHSGITRLIPGNCLAGELMFEYPEHIVLHAGSFYIGRPLPVLFIDDKLHGGETYFVVPTDYFPSQTLCIATLADLVGKQSGIRFSESAFEYAKGEDGRVLVKVSPEFMARVLSGGSGGGGGDEDGGWLCSTPELRKQYARLVGLRDRRWSPELETISEKKGRLSPWRLQGLRVKRRDEYRM